MKISNCQCCPRFSLPSLSHAILKSQPSSPLLPPAAPLLLLLLLLLLSLRRSQRQPSPSLLLSPSPSLLPLLLVWEWKSESYILKQQGHYFDVNCLAYSPDAQLLATGADDN